MQLDFGTLYSIGFLTVHMLSLLLTEYVKKQMIDLGWF